MNHVVGDVSKAQISYRVHQPACDHVGSGDSPWILGARDPRMARSRRIARTRVTRIDVGAGGQSRAITSTEARRAHRVPLVVEQTRIACASDGRMLVRACLTEDQL